MNVRLLVVALLLLIIVIGLTTGVFASSIQRALSVPGRQVATAGMAPTVRSTMPGGISAIPSAATNAAPATSPMSLASDSFRRQNQALWGTATDGRSWGGDANAPASKQAFAILNNSGLIVGNARLQSTFNALLGPNKDNVDILLKASIGRFTGGDNFGVVARWSDSNHWYKAYLDGSHLVLLKRVGQVSTRLSMVAFKAQGNVTYALRLRAIGANLFVRAWSSNVPEPTGWMIMTSDTDLRSGQPGLRVLLQNKNIVNASSFQVTAANGV